MTTVVKNKNTNHSRTVDHLIPRAMGGRTSIINLVTACRECNNRKGHHALAEVGMVLRPTPPHDKTRIRPQGTKRADTVCVNCGLGSKGAHSRPTYHGGPRQCRSGETFYFAQGHLDYLQSLGVC